MPKSGAASKPTRKSKTAKSNHAASVAPRMISAPKRIWYRPLTWHNHPPVPRYSPLSKARNICLEAIRLLWAHKKLFGGIVLLYGILNLLLVRGLAGSADLSSIKTLLRGDASGFATQLQSSGGTFLYLLGTSGSANSGVSGLYQSVLLVLCSLAFIWAMRQVIAKNGVTARDSFYQGMYPLIPYLLTCALLAVQLLPLVLAGFLYSTTISGGVAAHLWEQVLWIAICILLATWSLRMITATVFATYIVTLPNMTPLRAYRSARQLVYGRRLLLWRKLIFLPFILLVAAAIIELPIIMFLTPLAAWVFFVLSMVALPVVHSYLYSLYREML